MTTIRLQQRDPKPITWLFSAPVDIGVFLGSAVLAFVILWVGYMTGMLHDQTPDWAWVSCVLMIDVAHVYATGFRVYFDRDELSRRPLLYFGTPVACWLIGVALYSEDSDVFWRTMAYLAVFHFVRQQYGWVALYRSKAGETNRWERWIDNVAIYLATLYPLAFWHTYPRNFAWFDDPHNFITGLPAIVEQLLAPVYWCSLVLYFCKSLWLWRQGRANPGKDIVVATTALCWYVGIVMLNSDFAFTVTNVIIHGIPYFAIVFYYVRRSRASGSSRMSNGWTTFVKLMATVWLLAYFEELFWDRTIWNEREWLFGDSADIGAWDMILIPMLAVPQLTHYVLDGFIWRRKGNPQRGIEANES